MSIENTKFSNKRKKDYKKIFKNLLSEYQKDGYSEKEARKYASEEIEDMMIERKIKSFKKDM
tara:strand:+ start:261 stop:446 length:186 start_codon:yes stop_codon:yes gene_type:complete